MQPAQLAQLLLWAGLATATPTTWPRAVPSLDAAAFTEAQQRDDTATRAFSNTQIKTSDGKCLFVDELSGDFRANLTPIQVADCGTTDGQGWDVITKGKHNNVANSMLVVSTLTSACFNFDPRRAAGNQVLLFSCGGRADGGGQVTNSQLFSFNGTTPAATTTFQPENASGQCLGVKGKVLDVANCGGDGQGFTFVGTASSSSPVKTARYTMVRMRGKGKPEPTVAGGDGASSYLLPAANSSASTGDQDSSNSGNNNNNNHNGTANAAPAAKTNGTATVSPVVEGANNGTAAAAATKSGQGAKATSSAKGGDKNGDKKGKNGDGMNNDNNRTAADTGNKNDNNGKNGDKNGGKTTNNSNNKDNDGGKSASKNGTATATSNNDKDGKDGKTGAGKGTSKNRTTTIGAAAAASDTGKKGDKNDGGLLDLAGLLNSLEESE